jgi:hypothetical protein
VRAHFGIWNFDGRPVDAVQLARARTLLESLSTFPIRLLKRSDLAILDASGNGGRIAD